MQPLAPHHTTEMTRQFLNAMCAQVHSQLAVRGITEQARRACQAQANIDLETALALLRD